MSPVDDILRELYGNVSWLQQNSNSSDPMIAYYNKKAIDIKLNVSKATNFSFIADNSFIIDTSKNITYGTIFCSAPGKIAYMDSQLSCALFQLPYFLENIQFGYLCSILIVPIMLISLFGKIKESYRWFLLNQAIWDAFMCYAFICEKPSALAWSGGFYKNNLTCFYTQKSPNPFLDAIFVLLRGSFRNAPYIPLFLLAFSRCISLYFPNFYQRNNQSWKIIAFILIFDITIMILSNLPLLLQNIVAYLKPIAFENCFNSFCNEFKNYTAENMLCYKKYEKYFQCGHQMEAYLDKFRPYYRYTQISITPVMFIIVLICVFLLLFKVSYQLKYQLKHNRSAFLQTIKVVGIIFLQSITLTIYLLITSLQTYFQINAIGEYITDTSVYQKISPTIFLLQSLATTTSINIIRIFFDSFIVLVVLSGYRKRVFWVFSFMFNIRKQLQNRNNNRISTTAIKNFRS